MTKRTRAPKRIHVTFADGTTAMVDTNLDAPPVRAPWDTPARDRKGRFTRRGVLARLKGPTAP